MTRFAVLSGFSNPAEGMPKSLAEFKDFLTSGAGGSWRESEIIVTGPLAWPLAEFLRSRLKEVDFVLVYSCRKPVAGGVPVSDGGRNADCIETLRALTGGGRGIFIESVCGEVVPAGTLGYERAEETAGATETAEEGVVQRQGVSSENVRIFPLGKMCVI